MGLMLTVMLFIYVASFNVMKLETLIITDFYIIFIAFVIPIILYFITRFLKRYQKNILLLEVDNKQMKIFTANNKDAVTEVLDNLSKVINFENIEYIDYETKKPNLVIRIILFILFSVSFGPLYWLYLLTGRKKLLTLAIIVAGTISAASYLYFTEVKPIYNVLEQVNYNEIKKDLRQQNFKTTYNNNYEKVHNAVPNNKFYMLFFLHNDVVDTIEEAQVLRKGYSYKLNSEDFLRVVNGLGDLDKGYSKRLAKFFTDNMDDYNVMKLVKLEKGTDVSKNMTKLLKKYHQLSALRAYQALKKKYNIKA